MSRTSDSLEKLIRDMKRKREHENILSCLVFLLFIFVLGPAVWVGASYFEARAYNKVTGKNVSTFDAMFIGLRVQEGAK